MRRCGLGCRGAESVAAGAWLRDSGGCEATPIDGSCFECGVAGAWGEAKAGIAAATIRAFGRG